MLRRVLHWIDRDWERRRYLPLIAFGQRLLWIAPILLAILLMELAEALGASPSGPVTTAILIAGVVGCIITFAISMYRWFVGYGRTEWQEKQVVSQKVSKSAADRHGRSPTKPGQSI